MARPERHDADYFPFICKEGRTLFVLQHKYGLEGIGFFTNLMRFLTTTPDHHFCIKDPGDSLYFFSRIGIDENKGIQIIEDMVTTGKLHRWLWITCRVIVSPDLLENLKPLYDKRTNGIITIEEIVSTYGNPAAGEFPGTETTPESDPEGVSGVNNPQSKAEQSKEKHSRGCGHVDNSTPEAVLERIHRNNTYHLDFSGSECKQFSDILHQHDIPLEFIDFIFRKMRNASTEIRAPDRYFTTMLTKADKLHDLIQDWQREKPIDPLPRAGPLVLEKCPECSHTEFRKDGKEIMCMKCRNIWQIANGEWLKE